MVVLKTNEVKKEHFIAYKGRKYYFELGEGLQENVTFVENKNGEELMNFYLKHSECFINTPKRNNFYVCYNINGKQFILKFSRLRLLKEILKEIRYLF